MIGRLARGLRGLGSLACRAAIAADAAATLLDRWAEALDPTLAKRKTA